MAWLFEDPSTVLMAGTLILILLGVVLYQTGQARVLLAMAGVLVVMLVCVAIEIGVVTDREEVENTLYATADLIEANDVGGVLAHVAPEAGQMRSAVEANLSRWKITEARITDLSIEVDPNAVPPTAQVELAGRLNVDDPQNQSPYRNVWRRFTIQLRREGDTWQMVSYSERDIQDSF